MIEMLSIKYPLHVAVLYAVLTMFETQSKELII